MHTRLRMLKTTETEILTLRLPAIHEYEYDIENSRNS